MPGVRLRRGDIPLASWTFYMAEQVDIAVDLGVVPPPLPEILNLRQLVETAPAPPPQIPTVATYILGSSLAYWTKAPRLTPQKPVAVDHEVRSVIGVLTEHVSLNRNRAFR